MHSNDEYLKEKAYELVDEKEHEFPILPVFQQELISLLLLTSLVSTSVMPRSSPNTCLPRGRALMKAKFSTVLAGRLSVYKDRS